MATGAGNGVGNKCIEEAVEFASSFEEFVPGLANLLNDQAGWAANPRWICISAGWSRRLGRVVGVLFEPPDFCPKYSASGFVRPYVREFEALFPAEASDVLPLAQSQMRTIRKSLPLAGDGFVTVAHLQRDQIAERYGKSEIISFLISVTAFDLPTGRRLAALPMHLEKIGPPNLMNSHLLPRGVA